jgi:hypothetical protein
VHKPLCHERIYYKLGGGIFPVQLPRSRAVLPTMGWPGLLVEGGTRTHVSAYWLSGKVANPSYHLREKVMSCRVKRPETLLLNWLKGWESNPHAAFATLG